MSAAATALAVYSAQILIVIGVAGLAAVAVGLPLPAARLTYWRAVLVLCLLLPAVPDVGGAGPAAAVTFELVPLAPVAPQAPPPSWAPSLLAAVLWLAAAGAGVRLLWLAVGAVRLRQLRRRSQPARLDPSLEALRRSVAAGADVRLSDDIAQPVTFGWRRPVVLLPPGFDGLAPEAQQAVLCHELFHVQRRDWAGIVCEELLRSALWFHPAIWWALEQVHVSREQVVDRLVVARTSSRRAYMDALVHFAGAGEAARPAIAFLRRRHLASRLRQLSKEPHMTRLRLVSAAAALVFVMSGTAAVVLSALPLALPPLGQSSSSGTTLEVKLAELQPSAGLHEAVLESGQRIYVRPEAIVTGADVTGASVVDAGGRYSINVAFSSAASARLGEATKTHLGRPIAILLNGKVISAPTLRSMIRGSAVISGDFTRAEADRIASGLTGRAAAAASTPDSNSYVRETQRSLAILANETAGVPTAAPGSSAVAPVLILADGAVTAPGGLSLTTTPVAAPAAAQRYKGNDPGIVPPTAVTKVNPRYTQAAMDAKIQGDVQLTAVVREDGSVGEVTVVQSLDTTYGLDDSAVEAVRQWIFEPATKDGTAVEVEIQISIRFTLT